MRGAADAPMGAEPDEAGVPADAPRAVASQRWCDALLVHAPLAQDREPLLPAGLELDRHGGKAYVGVVAWRVRDAAPRWAPSVPFLSHFREVITRTYVTDGTHRGFWNLSWDVSSFPVAVGSRLSGLPFHWSTVEVGGGRCRCRRRWPDAADMLELELEPEPGPAEATELLEWLLSPRSLYLARRTKMIRSPVVHPSWSLQEARLGALAGRLVDDWGLDGRPLLHASSKDMVAEILPPDIRRR